MYLIIFGLYSSDKYHHSNVAKRMGDSCTQVGEPAVEKTGRPEGLPRTAVIKRLCARELLQNAASLRISPPSGRQTRIAM